MCHGMQCFNTFFNDSKQYSNTTATHSKRIIELLQNRQLIFANLSTIWGETYGWANQYQCATALYLPSMLAHAYNIMIGCGIGAP